MLHVSLEISLLIHFSSSVYNFASTSMIKAKKLSENYFSDSLFFINYIVYYSTTTFYNSLLANNKAS